GSVPAEVPGRVERVVILGGQETAIGVRIAKGPEQFTLALGRRGFEKEEFGLIENALPPGFAQLFFHEAAIVVSADEDADARSHAATGDGLPRQGCGARGKVFQSACSAERPARFGV